MQPKVGCQEAQLPASCIIAVAQVNKRADWTLRLDSCGRIQGKYAGQSLKTAAADCLKSKRVVLPDASAAHVGRMSQ